jgi:hypothetical protein
MATDDDFTPISLDSTLDDIEDLPQFMVFPTGAYHVKLNKGIIDKMSDKSDWINEHPALSAEMTLVETAEIDKKNLQQGEAPPAVGDIASLLFMVDNKMGAGQFKNFMAPIMEHLGCTTFREAIEQSIGLELAIVLQRTYNKQDEKHYQRFSKLMVL